MADVMRIRKSKEFVGAKVGILCGSDLVVYLRDDYDHIPDPNLWDLPGGEGENGETAFECAIRETQEEFAITLSEDDIVYETHYPSGRPGRADVAFFVVKVSASLVEQIKFGDEGQWWRLMPIEMFVNHAQAVAELRSVLAKYLRESTTPDPKGASDPERDRLI